MRLAISCCDLTSLEEDDDRSKIVALAQRALQPVPGDPSVPRCAAVCTWSHLLEPALEILDGTDVKVAAVAGDFPSGRGPLSTKVAEITSALEAGADEVDAVIDRRPLDAGDTSAVFEEVAAFREAAGEATLKVIIETGALAGVDAIRRASLLAMAAGADMVKTSTGKSAPGATPAAALVIAEAITDFSAATQTRVGLKVAGGIRRSADALRYLRLVRSELGEGWMDPRRFRIGASSLLDDLVAGLQA